MSNIKPMFIVDAMLGNLARKLRLFGFDSLYSSSIEDNELLRVAKNENRIVITKDVQLIQKAKKNEIMTISITGGNEMEQFFQINEKIKLGKCLVGGNTSRCPVCNGELEHIEKKDVENKVPLGVFENMQDFWICKNCEKIYWEGTHIKNLQKFIAELNERFS
jgi:uncharacterized protein